MEKNTKAINWKGGVNGVKPHFYYAGFQFCINEYTTEKETMFYLARYDNTNAMAAFFSLQARGEGKEFFKRWFKLRYGQETDHDLFFGDFDDWSYRFSPSIEFHGKEMYGRCYVTTINNGMRQGGFFNSVDEVKQFAEHWININFGSLVDNGTPAPVLDDPFRYDIKEVAEDV